MKPRVGVTSSEMWHKDLWGCLKVQSLPGQCWRTAQGRGSQKRSSLISNTYSAKWSRSGPICWPWGQVSQHGLCPNTSALLCLRAGFGSELTVKKHGQLVIQDLTSLIEQWRYSLGLQGWFQESLNQLLCGLEAAKTFLRGLLRTSDCIF